MLALAVRSVIKKAATQFLLASSVLTLDGDGENVV